MTPFVQSIIDFPENQIRKIVFEKNKHKFIIILKYLVRKILS